MEFPLCDAINRGCWRQEFRIITNNPSLRRPWPSSCGQNHHRTSDHTHHNHGCRCLRVCACTCAVVRGDSWPLPRLIWYMSQHFASVVSTSSVCAARPIRYLFRPSVGAVTEHQRGPWRWLMHIRVSGSCHSTAVGNPQREAPCLHKAPPHRTARHAWSCFWMWSKREVTIWCRNDAAGLKMSLPDRWPRYFPHAWPTLWISSNEILYWGIGEYLQWVSVVDDLKIITAYLFSPSLPYSVSRLFTLWSQASRSVVLKVCLCCYALWLGCQLTPTDLSQKADCRGIPITLPRPNPLSSLWHLSPFCQFPPLLLSSPFWSWQQRHPRGPPWCETHSWSFFPMFLYLIVALLSYSASTIFTH